MPKGTGHSRIIGRHDRAYPNVGRWGGVKIGVKMFQRKIKLCADKVGKLFSVRSDGQ
jgi:hypothetical protein